MGRKVLCYSVGLDSYILSKLYDYDSYCFFKIGTGENNREYELLMKYATDDVKNKLRIIELPLKQFEVLNNVVPYRNHIMAMCASNYGSDIHFGFTVGDTTLDTDFVFKSQVENILNYFSLIQYKVAHTEYPYTISMPLRTMTKADAIAHLLKTTNITIEQILRESRSCYSGGDKECGKCVSCLRKYHAFKQNGIELPVDKEEYEKFLTSTTMKGGVL